VDPVSDAPPVAIVGGRYLLTKCIGQGGMGTVWHAHHTSLRTPVAVKLLDPQLARQAELRSRFVREARAAAALQGDDVVRILDHGEEEGLPYIVMEFLEGESLGDRLSRDGVITPDFMGHVMASVCRAVARAHRVGIIHRDLNPDNVFLVRGAAQLPQVKVLDFGIAKVLADASSLAGSAAPTVTGSTMGTPYYMGPEQVRARKDLDQRADLWSLAVIAYECLTGRRPFDGESMGDLVIKICNDPVPVPSSVATVPRGFDAWFEKATRRSLAERFQTVQEMAAHLAEVLTPGRPWIEDRASDVGPLSATQPARPADPRASTQRTASRSVRPAEQGGGSLRRVGVAAIATVAVMSGAFVVYQTTKGDSPSHTATRDAVSAEPTTPRSTAVGAADSTPPTTTIEPKSTASSASSAPSASAAPSGAAPSSTVAGVPRTPPRVPSSSPFSPPVGASAAPKPSTGFVGVD
jgi:serine/threonine protein kinase